MKNDSNVPMLLNADFWLLMPHGKYNWNALRHCIRHCTVQCLLSHSTTVQLHNCTVGCIQPRVHVCTCLKANLLSRYCTYKSPKRSCAPLTLRNNTKLSTKIHTVPAHLTPVSCHHQKTEASVGVAATRQTHKRAPPQRAQRECRRALCPPQ